MPSKKLVTIKMWTTRDHITDVVYEHAECADTGIRSPAVM